LKYPDCIIIGVNVHQLVRHHKWPQGGDRRAPISAIPAAPPGLQELWFHCESPLNPFACNQPPTGLCLLVVALAQVAVAVGGCLQAKSPRATG